MVNATAQRAGWLSAWWLAVRPKTLAAGLVPVGLGTAIAHAHGGFRALPALAALVGAICIQIGTNLANDYFDALNGADTADRMGPTRVTQAGLISSESVWRASKFSFGLASLVGVYLVVQGGWPIVAIGIASIAAGICYTGGPRPYGYHGLGDVFVFVFFGLVAVTTTHYVQTLWWSGEALLSSTAIGMLSVAILVVNNIRDMPTDLACGKRTLATRIGRKRSELEFDLMVFSPYVICSLQAWTTQRPALLIPIATLPLAMQVRARLRAGEGAQLNDVLAQTARLLGAFGLTLSIGWFL
jgi:1,4-dihydroxy-2-naphthoate polyprenyltransferase